MSNTDSKIFLIKTSSNSVLEDYKKLLHLINYQNSFSKDQQIFGDVHRQQWDAFLVSTDNFSKEP